MDRESFQETLKEQYADHIHEAYLECEHEDGRTIDFKQLNALLTKLMNMAKGDGLPRRDFCDIVRSTLPDVADKLPMLQAPGKAA